MSIDHFKLFTKVAKYKNMSKIIYVTSMTFFEEKCNLRFFQIVEKMAVLRKKFKIWTKGFANMTTYNLLAKRRNLIGASSHFVFHTLKTFQYIYIIMVYLPSGHSCFSYPTLIYFFYNKLAEHKFFPYLWSQSCPIVTVLAPHFSSIQLLLLILFKNFLFL